MDLNYEKTFKKEFFCFQNHLLTYTILKENILFYILCSEEYSGEIRRRKYECII